MTTSLSASIMCGPCTGGMPAIVRMALPSDLSSSVMPSPASSPICMTYSPSTPLPPPHATSWVETIARAIVPTTPRLRQMRANPCITSPPDVWSFTRWRGGSLLLAQELEPARSILFRPRAAELAEELAHGLSHAGLIPHLRVLLRVLLRLLDLGFLAVAGGCVDPLSSAPTSGQQDGTHDEDSELGFHDSSSSWKVPLTRTQFCCFRGGMGLQGDSVARVWRRRTWRRGVAIARLERA